MTLCLSISVPVYLFQFHKFFISGHLPGLHLVAFLSTFSSLLSDMFFSSASTNFGIELPFSSMNCFWLSSLSTAFDSLSFHLPDNSVILIEILKEQLKNV